MNIEKINAVRNIVMPAVRANKIAKITFVKKDGTLREMTLHRSRALESTVKGTRAGAVEKRDWTLTKNGMLVCEELAADKTHQWRTVNLGTTTRVAVGGDVFEFNK